MKWSQNTTYCTIVRHSILTHRNFAGLESSQKTIDSYCTNDDIFLDFYRQPFAFHQESLPSKSLRVRISSPLPRSFLRLWLRASATLSVNNWPRVSISDDAARKGCARTREVCPARASITIYIAHHLIFTDSQSVIPCTRLLCPFFLSPSFLSFSRCPNLDRESRFLNSQQAYQSDDYLSKFIYRRDLFIWRIQRVKIWIYCFENI